MRLFIASAAVLGILTSGLLAPAQTQGEAETGVRIRIVVLKVSHSEKKASNGAVVVGPQTAIELEWRLLNGTSDTIEIPSPNALRLRVERRGGDIPVRMEWAPNMARRMRTNGELTVTTVATGPVSLTGGSSLWLRGSAERTDGLPFTPGEYVLTPDVGGLPPRRGDSGTLPRVDSGFPVGLRVVELDSPERRRQFHMIEGAFYESVDPNRALEHYAALASLPGAPWSDSLPLALTYSDLGRHRDASAVYRRILPDLVRALDGAFGRNLRRAHLRRAATAFAKEGDLELAARLLRLEGRTPEGRIPAELERLRGSAPR